MRRVLSLKRLGILSAVVVALSAGAVAVHAVQARRQADVIKVRAERTEAAAADDPAKLDEAAGLYKQYLKYRRTDEPTYARYAGLMIARAKAEPKYTEETINAVEGFLRQFPDHPDERRTLVDLSLKAGRLQSAKQHLTLLMEAPGGADDPDLLDLMATAEHKLGGDFGTVVKLLDAAVRSPKGKPETAARLLGLLAANPAFNHPSYTPDVYVELLLTREPHASDVAARMVAARYMLTRNELAKARGHIDHAVGKMPGGATHPEARMAAAELELLEVKGPETVQPQLKKAEDHLRTAAAAAPKNAAVGLVLSRVVADQGRRGEAIDILKRAAESLPEVNDQFLMVIDRLIDLDELDLSGRLIERLAANPADRGAAAYFRGRTAVVKGEWTSARDQLEAVAANTARVPDFHKKVLVGLGRCYEAFQNPDKMLEYHAAAAKLDTRYLPAVMGEAEALYKLGRLRDALPRYRTLVDGYRLEPFRPKLARIELRVALAQPAPTRKWDAFDAALGPYKGRPAELCLLHAESLAARGTPDKAAEVLDGVLAADKKNTAAWVALARVRGAADPARYAATLAEAEAAAGDSVELRLARAAVGGARGRRPTPDDLRPALAGAESMSAAQQNLLLRGVGEAAARATGGLPDADAAPLRNFAVECFQKAAALDKADLVSRAVLVDLGLSAGRTDVVNDALAGLAQAEGPNGPIGSLGRVVIRIPEVKKIEDATARAAAVRELRALATRAKDSRPGWGRVYISLARLDELEGLTDSALANYQAALDRGERDLFVVRRAVDLLRGKKQDDAAAALLNSVQTEVPLPEDLERFRAVRDLLARDLPQTERPTIDRIAPADHRDWRVLMLRGSLLAALGDDPAALEAFRGAVLYGQQVPEAWGAVVAQQVRLGRPDGAKETIRQAEDVLLKSPPATPALKADMVVTLGACHEMVGDAAAAEAKFREAVRVAPGELTPTRQLVLYLQRAGKAREADELLRLLGRGSAGDAARWARRHLALTVLTRPDAYQSRGDAMALIDLNLAVTPPDQEDVKAKALVQTIDPKTRAEGMKALGEFARWGDLTPDEYYHLGKLHFDQGKVFECVEFFEKATRARSGVSGEHLAALARVYMGTKNLEKARHTVLRLKAFSPRGWEAAREEARLLKREAEAAATKANPDLAAALTAEAKKRILDFPGATEDVFARTKSGPLLEELEYYPEAEALFARLAEQPGAANAHWPLALFLIHRKRSDEAIRLTFQHEAKTSVELTARLLTGAVRAKSPGPQAEQRVADWLDAKVKASIDPFEQLTLLGSRAELADALRKYDDAIASYETAIARAKGLSPEDQRRYPLDLFQNNLAMLLTLHRPAEADRAIATMSDVIAIRGPAPAYLDTRAVAYLVKGGRTGEAVEDLKLALVQQHRAAYLFHLGWAYDMDPAQRGLRDGPLADAKRLGITLDDLHPLEARKFAELYAPR